MFERLGRFQIRQLLGQGAMGEVYLGVDPAIGREVAIKTILAAAARGEEAKGRFEREAKAAGALNHPNLVTIYEFGEDQGVLYIAMEYVRGQDFEEFLREGGMTRIEALEILAQVCDGLSFAHRNGVIHRDIKPSNVRVIRDGARLQAKVMDFGVARTANSDMTATGTVMGTVSYMAPEYIRGGKPDPRSDLFAVGVMLYEVLSGRKPFSGDTTATILYKIINEAPEPIEEHQIQGVSASISAILERALAKDPEQRYQTAEELARALRAAKDMAWQGSVPDSTTRLQAAAPTARVMPAAPPVATQEPTAMLAPAPTDAIPSVTPAPRAKMRPTMLIAFGGLVVIAGGAYPTYRLLTRPEAPKAAQAAGPEAPAPTPPPRASEAPKPEAKPQSITPPKAATSAPTPQVKPQALPPQEPRPEPPKAQAPKGETLPATSSRFSQESLRRMDVLERRNLSLITMSEAIQLVDSNPGKAVEDFRNAIAANPTNPGPYAWAIAVLYEQGRYSEIPPLIRQARRNGIGHGQMAANMRFRMAMQREAMDHNIPGGRD